MEKGLTTSQAQEKLQLAGKNEIVSAKRISAIGIFASQFPTFINGILALAALFAFFISDMLDAFFIAGILVLNGFFGFIQEYRAEKSLEKLKTLITPLSRVFRDGKQIQIPTVELVVGDIVVLTEGDRIPADGTAESITSFEVDESILTGESLPVAKKKNDSLFKGTLLLKGKTTMRITKTGMETKFGQIAQSLTTLEADKTPLEVRLDGLGKTLSLIAIVLAGLLIPIGIAQGRELFPMMLLAVSIAIAAIPEGLPAVITIALAIGTNRMAKKQAIVRKMPAVETLGAIQVLLIDKTGTLTQNIMRVKKVWTREKNALSDLYAACLLGNTASLIKKADGERSDFDVVGDRTDGALLLFATEKVGKERKENIIDEFVFDPDTKTITTVVLRNGKEYVFVRGAPEIILEKSSMSKAEKDEIAHIIESYAKEGLRIIGFGKKIESHAKSPRDHLEEHLTFLGIVGIYDPPRTEAAKAMREANTAGVQTIMVTGDNETTALTIAKEVGLIYEGEDVITGDEMRKFSDEELLRILPKTRVFARTNPEDKLRLVELFKKQGFVVGVTGDGVNDALALKRADVGIAMGETGTDVAKEAADIVLTNDNFATIVRAIEEGRRIYDNILKAITYLLAGNLSELTLVVAATVLGMPLPLLPTQILWINIVTDGLPALALASDSKDPDLLSRLPRDPKTPILTNHRLVFIATFGIGIALLLLAVFAFLINTFTLTFARTITFNLLIFLHLCMTLVVRKQSILHMTRFLLAAFVITIALQVFITATPALREIFHLGF